MAQFEERYLADYLLARWPEGGYESHVPLGPIPDWLVELHGYANAIRLFRPWRPEVDAVKYWPDRLVLVEAKVFKTFDAIAKLNLYGMLIEHTEELAPWRGKAVELRLVTPRMTDILRELTVRLGIVIDLYITPHVLEHAGTYDRYWTAPYRRARETKLALRRQMGLD